MEKLEMYRKPRFKFDVEHIYVLCVVLAFTLLFYANADQQVAPDGSVTRLGIGKAFYLPCGVALCCSFKIRKKADYLDKKLGWMIAVILIVSLIHPPSDSKIMEWTVTRLLFAILCFKDLRHVDPLLVANYVAWFAPIIVFPHYLLSDPFSYGEYRYGGFYGDPNFLALALILVIALCYISVIKSNNIIFRMLCVTSILGAVPLIMAGMSRGGILGLFIIAFFMLRSLLKANKKIFMLVMIVAFFSFGSFINRFDELITNIEYRFSGESSSDQGGARARWEGIESVCNVLTDCPYLIPTGIGPGRTMSDVAKYRQHGYYCKYAVHNTYFSLLYEEGAIVLLLYLSIYVYIIKVHWRNKNMLLIGVLLSGTLSLSTLPGVCFMPGWIMLFLLSNKNIEKLNVERI